MELKKLAEIIDTCAGAAYHNALHASSRSDITWRHFKDFKPGQMVVEVTSSHRSPAIDRLGELISVTDEEMEWPQEAKDEWLEDPRNGPVPKERFYTIKTLDGREYRWHNADFIRIPDNRWECFQELRDNGERSHSNASSSSSSTGVGSPKYPRSAG